MINFDDIPDWWALCPNDDCPLAGDCLRRQACKEAPADVTRWMCVMPGVARGGACPYYQKAEPVKMARGMNRIYEGVSDPRVRSKLRLAITAHLGSRGSYYRYKDGERLINPELQQWIADLFRSNGVNAEPQYDEVFEAYDFTKTIG